MSRSTQKLEKVAEIIGKLNLLIIATGGSTVYVCHCTIIWEIMQCFRASNNYGYNCTCYITNHNK